jgi:hypothetical protein
VIVPLFLPVPAHRLTKSSSRFFGIFCSVMSFGLSPFKKVSAISFDASRNGAVIIAAAFFPYDFGAPGMT